MNVPPTQQRDPSRDKAFVDARAIIQSGGSRGRALQIMLSAGWEQKQAELLLNVLRPSLRERLSRWLLFAQARPGSFTAARAAAIGNLLRGVALLILCALLFGLSELTGILFFGLIMAGSGILGGLLVAFAFFRFMVDWPADCWVDRLW